MPVIVEKFSDSQIVITSDYPMRDKELIKQLPGSKYDMREHRWLAPLTWASCRAMRGIFGDRLEIGNDLIAWAQDERKNRVDPAIRLRNAANIDDNDDHLAQIVKGWRK